MGMCGRSSSCAKCILRPCHAKKNKSRPKRARRMSRCGSVRRTAIRRAPKKKCYRSGIVTQNAFFNFLRRYRRNPKNCGKNVVKIATEGAKIWNTLDPETKCKFMRQAYCAPPYKRRKGTHVKRLCRK